MRLLCWTSDGNLAYKEFSHEKIPPYAILSHTWSTEEFVFRDLLDGSGKEKQGYRKIEFCGKQAVRDNLRYFWVDTCCIDKWSLTELSEAINSMFHWYQNAARCYVLLSDVSTRGVLDSYLPQSSWEQAFKGSRWFSRGWTLQELIAPASVDFFSAEHDRLGDKISLLQMIHETSNVPVNALHAANLQSFSVAERMAWSERRQTTIPEDHAYCLLGIFSIHMPLIYGEGKENALKRLVKEIACSIDKGTISVYTLFHSLIQQLQVKAHLSFHFNGTTDSQALNHSSPS